LLTWAAVIRSHQLNSTHPVPNLERSGYFRFSALPISLALPSATAIHLKQGTGFVSLPLAAPTVRPVLLFDRSSPKSGQILPDMGKSLLPHEKSDMSKARRIAILV